MKLLLLDIETAPNLVHVWGLWQQNVGINQIIASSYVMCWSAKWYGQEDIYFDSIHQSTHKGMIKSIYELISEADAVVHYNGTKFDMPTLNKEFLLLGLSPPPPYKQIDLLRTARSSFRFPSNKLDYIAQALGLGEKTHHRGHQLWIDCMDKDSQAWAEMEEYNINDVVLLEAVYERLKPWIKNHPNHQLYTGAGGTRCPKCGSLHFQSRGFAYTSGAKYQRYQCKDCKGWFRSSKWVSSARLSTEKVTNAN